MGVWHQRCDNNVMRIYVHTSSLWTWLHRLVELRTPTALRLFQCISRTSQKALINEYEFLPWWARIISVLQTKHGPALIRRSNILEDKREWRKRQFFTDVIFLILTGKYRNMPNKGSVVFKITYKAFHDISHTHPHIPHTIFCHSLGALNILF